MMSYVFVKWLHVVSSTVLFGTGVGSAFYLLFASLRAEPRTVATVASLVVWADTVFTATTDILQPLTGLWLAGQAGWPLGQGWLKWSLVLYAFAMACWLPVVALQIRMRNTARAAVQAGTSLPPAYWRDLRIWTALGVPAFFAFLALFYLMVAKPAW